VQHHENPGPDHDHAERRAGPHRHHARRPDDGDRPNTAARPGDDPTDAAEATQLTRIAIQPTDPPSPWAGMRPGAAHSVTRLTASQLENRLLFGSEGPGGPPRGHGVRC
jgi:hypothetical protein